MAQHVGYWANDIIYTEGPFVICGGPIGADAGRIECEVKEHYTCSVVHPSIRPLIEKYKSDKPFAKKAEIVDWLNSLTREGKIVCVKSDRGYGVWEAK